MVRPGYEDYFLTRWGPDARINGSGAFWGVLVNDVFTKVGGCQYQLDDGDEVLWVHDAFRSRPTLALFPEEAAYYGRAATATATAQLGIPFPVEVVSYADDAEGTRRSGPTRSRLGALRGRRGRAGHDQRQRLEKVDVASPER